jgi:hypothetical protein
MNGFGRLFRRKRIWVDTRFQAKYTALVAGVAAAIMTVLGLLWMDTLAEERRMMGVTRMVQGTTVMLDARAEEFDRDLVDLVESGDRDRAIRLFATAMALVVLLAYLGVRITFRAAGPAYAISQMLRCMAGGDFNAPRALRRGDEFRFLEEDVFALRATLRVQAQVDVELLKRARAVLSDLEDHRMLAQELCESVRAREAAFGLMEPGRAGERVECKS